MSRAGGPTYCLDTSALIEAATRSYPPDSFPTFWSKLDGLVAAGRVASPDAVKREIEKKSDAATAWAKANSHVFAPPDERVQLRLARLVERYPGMMAAGGKSNTADPLVVALAWERGYTVVTQERSGSASHPRIPWVCKPNGIPCIKLIDLIRQERWIF